MNIGVFEEDWEISLADKQVRRRGFSLFKRFCKWRKRYPLSTFHTFVRRNFEAMEAGIVHSVILNADYMKPVKGVPTKLELVNGWTVPEKDLGRMIGDNHVLIHAGSVVVPETKSRILSSVELKPGLYGFSIDLKKLFGGE